MGQAFSAILSPAVGILISPFPIVGLILILLSDKARANSILYMLGWIIGNTVTFTLAMLFMGAGMSSQDDPSTIVRIVFLVLGILLIIMAVHSFMQRPKAGAEPKTPKWFAKMSKIGPLGAGGFGLVLSALNPKNLMLSLSAGASVGALTLTGSQQALITVIFVALASCAIVIPTIAFLFAGKRLNHVLNDVRAWLVHHNAIIMAVLLLLIGLSTIGKAF